MGKKEESVKTLLKVLELRDIFVIRDALKTLADYGLADRDLLYMVMKEIEKRGRE